MVMIVNAVNYKDLHITICGISFVVDSFRSHPLVIQSDVKGTHIVDLHIHA